MDDCVMLWFFGSVTNAWCMDGDELVLHPNGSKSDFKSTDAQGTNVYFTIVNTIMCCLVEKQINNE